MVTKREAQAALDVLRSYVGEQPDAPAPTPTPAPAPTPAPTPTLPSAAARLGWGAPTWVDDFSAGLDPAKWQNSPAKGMDGHGHNGRRIASSAYVRDGVLTLRGLPNGDTGWIRQNLRARSGRWEVTVRAENVGRSGAEYHPVALIWPTSERWPEDGEYDFWENSSPDQQVTGAFLHYPHDKGDVQQEYREFRRPLREWTNIAFEWSPAGLKGWVNGQEWYSLAGGARGRVGKNPPRRDLQSMPEGYLTFQLDNFTGNSGLREAIMQVDSVKYWRL